MSFDATRSSRSPDWFVRMLAAAVVVLLAIIALLLFRQSSERTGDPGDGPLPPPPRTVSSDRIQATAKQGRTYDIVLKGELTSEGFSREWGTEISVYIQWIFECVMTRTIESNDGMTVVELRRYEAVRDVRLDATARDVRFDFGVAGELALGFLEGFKPGSSVLLRSLEPYASQMVLATAQQRLDELAKATVAVDSLSGKSFRITYKNGVGVTDIAPVGCSMTPTEADFLRQTAVIADSYIMEDLDWKPGEDKTLDGRNLVGFIAPSLRAQTSGEIVLTRKSDFSAGSHRATRLEISRGDLEIDSTTPQRYEIGTFVPRGVLVFDLDDQYVTSGDLVGEAAITNCSRDHILFETSFRARPEMKVVYSCRIR